MYLRSERPYVLPEGGQESPPPDAVKVNLWALEALARKVHEAEASNEECSDCGHSEWAVDAVYFTPDGAEVDGFNLYCHQCWKQWQKDVLS